MNLEERAALQSEPKQLMKISQLARLQESVPPLNSGGIELVVSCLSDELVCRGYEVTLFASGDSQTLTFIEAVYPRALRLDNKFTNILLKTALI